MLSPRDVDQVGCWELVWVDGVEEASDAGLVVLFDTGAVIVGTISGK